MNHVYQNGAYKNVSDDANGNVTVHGVQGITATQYDWRNLPKSVTASGTVKHSYDGEGNRVMKERVSGTKTHYVRGANGETIAIYENGSRKNINLLAGSEVIGTWDGSQRRYFIKDHLGSIRTTVDQSGNVDGYDDYYAFGLVMPGRSSNSANPTDNYKFTGHERDTEASLTIDHMGARGYDPVTGRFLQTDPMMEFASPYTYVGNNPMNLVDPTGMFSCNDGESQDECNQRYGQQAQAEWDAIDAGASISDVWGANAILNTTPSNFEQPRTTRKPNPNMWEMDIYNEENLDIALSVMWQLSNSGGERSQVREINGYYVENTDGSLSLIIFNPASAGNSATSSNNPLLRNRNPQTGRYLWNGSDVIAQFHTHPTYRSNGTLYGGSFRGSPQDIDFSRNFAPVFILTPNGVSYSKAGSPFRPIGGSLNNFVMNSNSIINGILKR